MKAMTVSLADTARVLSRFVDAIMIRILDHDDLNELAANATVPVINGLTKRSHPCQIMADLMTFEEHRGSIKGKSVAWTGDSNNVLASWVHAAPRMDFELRIATPPELAPPPALIEAARAEGASIIVTDDPFAAVKGKVGEVSEITPTSFFVTAQGGRIEVLKAKGEDTKKIGGAELAAALGLGREPARPAAGRAGRSGLFRKRHVHSA